MGNKHIDRKLAKQIKKREKREMEDARQAIRMNNILTAIGVFVAVIGVVVAVVGFMQPDVHPGKVIGGAVLFLPAVHVHIDWYPDWRWQRLTRPTRQSAP